MSPTLCPGSIRLVPYQPIEKSSWTAEAVGPFEDSAVIVDDKWLGALSKDRNDPHDQTIQAFYEEAWSTAERAKHLF